MGVEIYYFSGTGNSLHVARELKKRIPDTELIPLIRLLDKETIEISADTVGFVFPIHMAMSPGPVRKFIDKLDLKSAEYIFAIATRFGTPHRAFIDVENRLKKKGKLLDSFFSVNMASNDPKFDDWHEATEEEIADLDVEVQNSLDLIQKIILNKEQSRKKDTTFTSDMPAFSIISVFLPFLNRFYSVQFYSDSKCVSCGTCEKVCLSEKIKLINEEPLWQKEIPCFSCYACINYCPQQAIQIKSPRFLKTYTEVNGRYSHPYATVEDIARQK
ncbi:EFR1 family ferrodoxin [Methanobacterium sp. BAmetb5]|jgi:ferredoxin|uniref:EFR1 family ferrodoxin n=1 Tax=Methanobacterium sp. BAmetb5 TaxID=2025351 RepID=UPI000E976BA6|nr:EFR1 family ferrodoxin [Methanobacterium sp. BAmetb5]AXV40299.1 MAG: ferredoxin [Methanobacterium sp. BAmetb5]